MANRLKMAIVTSILTFHKRGWSQRRIARDLGVSRTTMRRHLAQSQRDSNCTSNPPPGAGRPPASGPPSLCEPAAEAIEIKLAQGLRGVRVSQDLVADHPFCHNRHLKTIASNTSPEMVCSQYVVLRKRLWKFLDATSGPGKAPNSREQSENTFLISVSN